MIDIQKVIRYLFKKLDSLNYAYVSIEADLQTEIDGLANSGLPEPEISRAYHHYEYIVANLSRQAMLVMVCACLEEAMDFLGEVSISDYEARLAKKNKGNWFKKRKKLFEESGVSFNTVAEDCDRIGDFLEVRNCIVHAGGRVETYRYRTRLERAVTQLKERDKDKNINLVEISADQFLYLGDNAVTIVLIAAEAIIEQCFESLKAI